MNNTEYFKAFSSIEVAPLPSQEKLRNGDYFKIEDTIAGETYHGTITSKASQDYGDNLNS